MTTSAPTRLDPLQLFLDADIVVQVVIVGLVLASIWVWTIIVAFSLRMGRVRRRSEGFELDFWDAEQPEALVGGNKRQDNPSVRVAAAGLAELRDSTKDGLRNREGAKQRIALAMEGQVAAEADALAERLNFLATTGSVAPFVGLFGTVWGIMNSFFQIGTQQSSSLAVVAPGIAEALLATALGLFAAIPAVVIYNVFSRSIGGYRALLADGSALVMRLLSRDCECGSMSMSRAAE